MTKTSKKFISIILACAFLMSLLPSSVMADTTGQKTDTVYFSNGTFTRSDRPTNTGSVWTYNAKRGITLSRDHIYSYMQLDLSGYEAILNDENTTVTANIVCGGYFNGNKTCGDFVAYVVTDSADKSYNSESITYEQANKLNMHDKNRPVLFVRSDGTKTTGTKSLPIDKKVLLDALNEGTDNSLVTLYMVDSETSGTNIVCSATSYITITYNETDTLNQNYVSDIAENIEWSDLSNDSPGAVENNLPTQYKGATITWSANNGLVTPDGTIVPPTGTAEETVLTATFSYKGTTATTDFNVTVMPEEAKTVKIYFKNGSWTWPDKGDNWTSTDYSGTSCVQLGSGRRGYMQIDLSGFEEILADETTSVNTTVKCGVYAGSVLRCYNFKAYLVNDKADKAYVAGETVFAEAESLGMHDKTNLFFERTSTEGVNNTETFEVNKSALLSCINSGTSSSLATIYLDGESTLSTIVPASSYITITYYESRVNNKEYVDSLESEFAWNKISSDEQSLVTNNLGTYYNGLNIEWSSVNGTVTSSGEIIATDGQIVEDTVTATASFKDYSFTKEYAIKVCDGKITIGSPALNIADSTATANITIVNGTPEDTTYLLYLAIYDGTGVMTELVPFPMEISKGTTGYKDLSSSCPTGSRAKFMVWESDGITPAIHSLDK